MHNHTIALLYYNTRVWGWSQHGFQKCVSCAMNIWLVESTLQVKQSVHLVINGSYVTKIMLWACFLLKLFWFILYGMIRYVGKTSNRFEVNLNMHTQSLCKFKTAKIHAIVRFQPKVRAFLVMAVPFLGYLFYHSEVDQSCWKNNNKCTHQSSTNFVTATVEDEQYTDRFSRTCNTQLINIITSTEL